MNVSRRIVQPFGRTLQQPYILRFLQTVCKDGNGLRSAQLVHRSLVRVCGEDSGTFLQGLITADVSTLSQHRALYSMILNAQGRVLYDIILYHHGDDDQLIECDSRAVNDVIKHFKRYALRSKVTISSVECEHKLWALFPGSHEEESIPTHTNSFPDPRLRAFGTRVITDASSTSLDSSFNATEDTIDEYHCHRLRTGIAEGLDEVPLGSCFPLEYNLDLLNGVSFQKGCYVGQELTARTYHTGVVRKRVMPVSFNNSPTRDIPAGSAIVNSKGKSMGKMVCQRGDIGLALLRFSQSRKEDVFLKDPLENGEQLQLHPHTPNWWPTNLTE